jgi:hypothetical protein
MLLIVVRRSMLVYAKYRVAHAESRSRGGMLLIVVSRSMLAYARWCLFSRTEHTPSHSVIPCRLRATITLPQRHSMPVACNHNPPTASFHAGCMQP